MKNLYLEIMKAFDERCETFNTTRQGAIAFMVSAVFGFVTVGLIFVIALTSLYAVPVWICWNHAAVPLFGVPSASFSQAYALALLCSLLIKSYNMDFGKK